MANNKRSGYLVEYEVEGRVSFPFDMLRYDCSWPHQEKDSSKIERSLEPFARRETREAGESFRVTLRRLAWQSDWNPTAARWESFLWRVVPGSVRVVE